jgi:hypothetical protein
MKKIYSSLLFSFGISISAFSQCTNASDLLFDFPLNNSSADVSSYSQPVLDFGTVTYTTDRFGNSNSALNTTSGTIFLTNDVGGNFKCQFPITFSSWVKINTVNSRNPVFCNEDAGSNISGVYVEILPNSTINVRVGENFGSNAKNYTTTATVSTGQWFHLSVVLNSINDFKIYLDGTEVSGAYTGTGTALGYLNMTGTAGKIGSGVNGTGTNLFLSGAMDEVKFWNASLQQFQIDALYNSHVDALVEDTVTICEGASNQVVFPFNSCDVSWSNGDNDSICNFSGAALGLGTHSIYMTAYDDMNIAYTDSVVVIVESCLSTNENEFAEMVSIYPNPTSSQLYFNFSNELINNVVIFDITGKIIHSENFIGNNGRMNIESFASGIYHVRINSPLGTKTQKIIIE